MSVRKLKPITPGQRFRVVNGYDAITTDKPEKSLLAPKKRSGGRNSQGKMTMRYIGGGHKKRYRIIDFKRDKAGIPAEVKSIEYDPNRTAFIALLNYQDGEKRLYHCTKRSSSRAKVSVRCQMLLQKLEMHAIKSNSIRNHHFLYRTSSGTRSCYGT